MAEITGFGILQNLDVYYKAFVEGKVEIDLPFAYAKVESFCRRYLFFCR